MLLAISMRLAGTKVQVSNTTALNTNITSFTVSPRWYIAGVVLSSLCFGSHGTQWCSQDLKEGAGRERRLHGLRAHFCKTTPILHVAMVSL